MDNVKTFFDSFKEFIWDIIGYLLPGSYLLILISICINSYYLFSLELGNIYLNIFPYGFIIISYVLGHVAYGFGLLKENILGKCSYTQKIELKISKKFTYDLAKKIISKSILTREPTADIDTMSFREFRNIAMSFIPEMDQKIYTFTFRSDLSNQTGNISLMIGSIGLFFFIFKPTCFNLFIVDSSYIILYLSLIFSYFLLMKTRDRFYAISLGLPFSIYLIKSLKNDI